MDQRVHVLFVPFLFPWQVGAFAPCVMTGLKGLWRVSTTEVMAGLKGL
jgi:hypothetical protein